MKKVVLVTAHFPPSNLVGVHRARIWSQYLTEFGWQPTVLTSHWKYYEEVLDWGLMELVDPDLQVIRTKALGTKPIRVLGNMALRAMWWARRALDELLSENQVDFVHIIVPDHFSALLGPRVHARYKIPYGIDYVDPWVHDSPRSKKLFSKAWISCCLSYVCEPWAVKHARLITGVSEPYYADVFERNPSLKGQALTTAIPMSNSERDFDAISKGYVPREKLFDPEDGRFHLVYAGALLPRAHGVLERLLRAIKELVDEEHLEDKLKITFIGTGRAPDDAGGHNILPRVNRHGLSRVVSEHPARIAYLDVLWHLKAASAVLILGSTERHYTPSKVFQGIQARNPVLALLHKESAAAMLLRESRAGVVVDVPDNGLVDIDESKRALKKLLSSSEESNPVRHELLEAHSAREGARRLAEAMDAVCLS